MIDVARIICDIYVTTSLNGRRNRYMDDIETLLLFMIKFEKEKHARFLKYFKKNDKFRSALIPGTELSELLTKMYLEDVFKPEEYEVSGKPTQYSEENCKTKKEELDKLIKNGGSFTKKDALLLEFCDKAFERFLE